MRVALISDPHLPSLIRTPDELGPQLAAFLAGVDLILHAGDVVRPFVLDWCQQFAPIVVAQGNNDDFSDPRMEKRQILDIEGWRIGMVHELRPEDRPGPVLLARALGGERVDVLIGGDTHVERLEYRDGVVVVNSGSPTLPHHKEFRLGTVALLELAPGRLHAEIISLGHSEGARNPATPRHLELQDRRLVAHSLNGERLPLPASDPAD